MGLPRQDERRVFYSRARINFPPGPNTKKENTHAKRRPVFRTGRLSQERMFSLWRKQVCAGPTLPTRTAPKATAKQSLRKTSSRPCRSLRARPKPAKRKPKRKSLIQQWTKGWYRHPAAGRPGKTRPPGLALPTSAGRRKRPGHGRPPKTSAPPAPRARCNGS